MSTSADFIGTLLTKTTASRLSTGTYYALYPELLLNQRYYVRVKTNLSEVWGRTTTFTRVSPVARMALEEALLAGEWAIQLYPNPFEDKLTLSSSQPGRHSITVVDNLGRVVYQTMAQGTETELNLAHLKAGVYIVKVSVEDGQTQVIKVVKR